MNGPKPNLLFDNAGRGQVKSDLGLSRSEHLTDFSDFKGEYALRREKDKINANRLSRI